jgi:hypothetical protein
VYPRRRTDFEIAPVNPGPIGKQSQHRRPGVRHDTVPADFDAQIVRPRVQLHLKVLLGLSDPQSQ